MPTDLLETICKKLADNNINCEIIDSEIENVPRKIKFKINSGRKENDCITYEEDSILKKIIDSNFEKYKFILGYEAIWSSSLRKIECEITQSGSLYRPLPRTILLRKLSRYIPSFKHTLDSYNSSSNDEYSHVEIISLELQPIGNIKVSIGLCSDEFAILSACRQWEYDIDRLQKFRVTLKLSDIEVKTHDEAYKIMEKISNSLFFQIDLVADFSINLVTQRESRIQQRKMLKRRANRNPDVELEAPKYEYDPESIAFYWHAKNNSNMPLFQFLAYYQVIEFYFPVYSNYEAKQKL